MSHEIVGIFLFIFGIVAWWALVYLLTKPERQSEPVSRPVQGWGGVGYSFDRRDPDGLPLSPEMTE